MPGFTDQKADQLQEEEAGFWKLLPMLIVVFIDLIGTGLLIPTVSFLVDIEAGVLGPEVSEFWRNLALGLLISIFPLSQFVAGPVLGDASDNMGRKKIIIFSQWGTTIANLLFAWGIWMGLLPVMLMARALDGFTGGSVSVAVTAVADMSTKKTKSRNFAYVGVAVMFGIVLGPLLGGYLSDSKLVSWFGLWTPFVAVAILAGLNSFFVYGFFKETRQKSVSKHKIRLFSSLKNVSQALMNRHLRTIFAVIFFQTMGLMLFIYFIPVYAVERLGVDQSTTADITAYVAVWVVLVQVGLAIPLSKKYLPEQILPISLIGSSLSLLTIFWVSEVWMVFVVTPVIAAFQSITEPNNGALLSNIASEDEQGKALGVKQSITSLGQGIAPLIGGFIVNFGEAWPIVVASGITFIGWVIFQWRFQPIEKKMYDDMERAADSFSQ